MIKSTRSSSDKYEVWGQPNIQEILSQKEEEEEEAASKKEIKKNFVSLDKIIKSVAKWLWKNNFKLPVSRVWKF